MPIRGLTDRAASFPEIGQVRKGAPKPADGKRPGADLTWFRVEFDEREVEAAATFKGEYGEQPDEINVLLPFNVVDENFDAWREAYVAGGLIHRCDGDRIQYELGHGAKPAVVDGRPEKKCDGTAGCKPVGRLKVLVPELHRLAYLTVMTTSLHDIMNLHRQLEALLQINGKLSGVPLKLRRRPMMISTPSGPDGKRARREKWLLSIEADPQWVKAKILAMKAAALPGNGLGEDVPMLEAPDEPDEGGPEWIESVVTAGEVASEAAVPAGRPYPPEVLRTKILDRTMANEGKACSAEQRGLAMGMLNECFAGQKDSEKLRHSVLKFLCEVTSGNDLQPAQVLALLDWLKPTKDSGGAYKPDADAVREAQGIVRAVLLEAGQTTLFGE
jgi:hypothetical protein